QARKKGAEANYSFICKRCRTKPLLFFSCVKMFIPCLSVFFAPGALFLVHKTTILFVCAIILICFHALHIRILYLHLEQIFLSAMPKPNRRTNSASAFHSDVNTLQQREYFGCGKTF